MLARNLESESHQIRDRLVLEVRLADFDNGQLGGRLLGEGRDSYVRTNLNGGSVSETASSDGSAARGRANGAKGTT